MGCFELSGNSVKTWEINSDLVDYTKKHIKTFVLNQTLIEGILSANLIHTNIKEVFLLYPCLRKLLPDQGKRFQLNQEKSLVNL